jgi:hypothetical protein
MKIFASTGPSRAIGAQCIALRIAIGALHPFTIRDGPR